MKIDGLGPKSLVDSWVGVSCITYAMMSFFNGLRTFSSLSRKDSLSTYCWSSIFLPAGSSIEHFVSNFIEN